MQREVLPYSVEGRALADYFLGVMPEDTQLQRILRIENRQSWRQFKVYRNEVYDKFAKDNWHTDGIETYLWHGSDSVDAEATNGFDIAHANLDFNMYGAGVYFASDPRLSHYFIRENRNRPHARCKQILARVVVGWCATKAPVKSHVPNCWNKRVNCWNQKCRNLRAEELKKPEHRKAPGEHHSCSSKHSTEVIVYKDYHAYPAYLFEYQCASLAKFDPYSEQNFQTLRQINWRISRSQ